MTLKLPVGIAAMMLTATIAVPSVAAAQSLAGLWDATVAVGKNEIPFRFEIAGDGAAIKGSFPSRRSSISARQSEFGPRRSAKLRTAGGGSGTPAFRTSAIPALLG